jgi:hypothetical protein
MNLNRPTLFLDIDDVMVTSRQYFFSKPNPTYNGMPFDPKCVKVLNEIIEKTNPIIILSSDWKLHFNFIQLNEIFKENGVNSEITDITSDLWGDKFKNLNQLDECRATEILKFVEDHKILKFVAVDDLNLKPWLPDNFVWCTQSNEGIKQSGVKEKLLKILN